jgi:hypothetical protein
MSRALVGTSQHVYLLDLDSGAAVPIASGQGLYYGITWDTQMIYVVAADYHRWIRKWTRPKVLVFDPTLRQMDRLVPTIRLRGGVHQAHVHPMTGAIWFASSKDNAVIIQQNSRWEIWQPLEEGLKQWKTRLGDQASKRWDQPRGDVHHLNSVWMDKHRIYLVAHNWGPSEVYVFDLHTRRPEAKYTMGRCAHNVWRENDEILVCSSAEGTVVNQYGNTKCQIDGFTRGMAKDNERRLLGISEKKDRKNRTQTDATVVELDNQWHERTRYKLEGAGQVLEVRLLSSKDRCHNELPPPVTPAVLEGSVEDFDVRRRTCDSTT